MEGRGFLKGVRISHPVRGCVVRGISDLLSGKADADEAGSQLRAADAASAAAFEILSGLGGGTIATLRGKPSAKFIEKRSTFSPSASEVSSHSIPPLGTLRFVIATLELTIDQSAKDIAGKITVEIHNDSDKLTYFHAITRKLQVNKQDGLTNPSFVGIF